MVLFFYRICTADKSGRQGMVKVDLITGFLGSGKTTFIRKYVGHLLDMGQRIAILENDFGAVNVDMMLLKDLEGDNCSLEMIAGGCDLDCHIRRTRTKLIALGMQGFDRVIVEPSGIYDVEPPECTIETLECFRYGLRRILSKSSNLITQALSLTRRIVLLHESSHQCFPILHRLHR